MSVAIRLMGEFYVNDSPIEQTLKGRKNQAILAYLAHHLGDPVDRDTLTRLLWPEDEPGAAKASLRQALATIRRALPEGAVAMQGRLPYLDPKIVSVDVSPNVPLQHETFGTLVRGPWLDGFSVRSPAFEEWLSAERATVHTAVLDQLHRYAVELKSNGEGEQALEVLQRALWLDDTSETLYREIIELHRQLGHPVEAMQVFQHASAALASKLSMEPSNALQKLVEDLELGSEHRTGVVATTRKAILPAIGVLPFVNLSAESDDDVLADGMTDELINLLSQSSSWRVASRHSSVALKNTLMDVKEVGQALGVNYVVEGSTRRHKKALRLTVRLVGVEDGLNLWSHRYECALSDIFELQDEVAESISQAIKNRLGFVERERVRHTPPSQLDAWSLLIKAQQVIVVDRESRDLQRALAMNALEVDPDYPRAHAFLAMILFVGVGRGYAATSKADFALGLKHADIALASAPFDVVVLRSCAGGYAAVGRSEMARKLVMRVYDMTRVPDTLLVSVLMWNGELEQAEQHCQSIVDGLAPELSTGPAELRPRALLGNLHMLQGRYQEALPYAERDLVENPSNYFAHVNLANVLGYLGQSEEAARTWADACALVPELSITLFHRGYQEVCTDDAVAAGFVNGLLAAGIPSK